MIEKIESLSVILASLVAVYGIRSWRVEMRGRREYEIAEEVLARAYEFQDKLQYIRMPIEIGGEVSSRQRADGETPEQTHGLNRAYAALERYRSVADELAAFYATKNRVSVVLGRPAAEPINKLQDLAAEVVFAIYQIPRTVKGQVSAGFGEVDVGTISSPSHKRYMRAEQQDLERIAFNYLSEDDRISREVEEALTKLEELCAPELRSVSLWRRWRNLVTQASS